VARGVTREGKGSQFPGRRITAGGAKKSQQCHKYFRQYSTFASEKHQVRTRGAKLASWPGRHLASLRPWVWWVLQQIISLPYIGTSHWWVMGINFRKDMLHKNFKFYVEVI